MKKCLMWFLVFCIAFLMLTSCTKQENSPVTDSPSPTPSSQTNEGEDLPANPSDNNEHYNDHTAYSQFPLVAEGDQMTISVAIPRDDNYGIDAEKMWFWIWSEQVTGIDFEVEQISRSALDERKSLMFASGDLPDILFGLGITPDEMVRYGMVEGLLKDLTDSINNNTMPWLSKWFAEYPEALALCTTPDGKVYTLPGFSDFYITNQPETGYVRKSMLEAVGLELPKTVDEFTEMLYTFKEAYSEAVPLGGGAQASDIRNYLYNAFGYLTTVGNDTGAKVAMKDGQVVVPVYDKDFINVLRLLNQYYVDGIISEDYFTIDTTAFKADMAADKVCVTAQAAYEANPDISFFQDWLALYPLTSEYNKTAQWLDESNKIRIGNFSVNAEVEDDKLDAIMRYADFFFSDLGGMYLWCGPASTSADTLGIVGGYKSDESGVVTYLDVESGKFEDNMSYLNGASAGLAHGFGNRSHPITKEIFDKGVTCRPEMRHYFNGDKIIPYTYYRDQASGYALAEITEKVVPYVVEGFPSIVYYDETIMQEMIELESVIFPYVESEIAKFITCARSLDEFENFRMELKELNIETYLNNLKEAYDNYISAMSR